MQDFQHGLSIGMSRVQNRFYLTLTIIGELTHEDYQSITPLIDNALYGVKEPKIDALIDIQALKGWELRAAWDDLQLGLKHGSEFNKVAIVTPDRFYDFIAKVSSWFVEGEVVTFDNKEDAIPWLQQ